MRMIPGFAIFIFGAMFLAASDRSVLPVAGSTAGAFGSNFKTSLQLHNRSAQTMKGRIVFHKLGQPGAAGDPSLTYELAPHATMKFDDVVGAMGQSGLGSIDIVPDGKGFPTVVARAFDDKGDKGTTGATIEAIRAADVVPAGEATTLVVPDSLQQYRFNIGVRTLSDGAVVEMSIYGANGILRKTLTARTFPADYFVQQASNDFLGETLLANESIAFKVVSGSAIVYGTTTDNTTNDPSVQIGRRSIP